MTYPKINPENLPHVCYEIFIRSFCDSNQDKIGDLHGIISKLDYLQDLGIEAIWITSVHPSPSYHKYDVVDYFNIDPEYGHLDDYKLLIREAHQRNIQIYHDLVINHTSILHEWFQEAAKGPDNPFRTFYRWMTQEQIDEAGVAEREQTDDSGEANPWHEHPGNKEKYYGLFINEMPDLNFDTDEVRREIYKITRFWLEEVGVDGLRLDAARHIYPVWEKEKNPEFWKEFGQVVANSNPNALTIGEVWAHAEEVAPYFQGLHSTFHFDLSFAIQQILIEEEDFGLVEKLKDDYALFRRYNPDFVDATMLTNHDQNRIGSVVKGDKQKIKLAASLLLTLPGLPFIYYGEEIGMLGEKPDPEIREAFLWSADPEDGQLAAWRKSVHSTPDTVKDLLSQINDPESVYHHYKTLIQLRRQLPALGQVINPNLTDIRLESDQLLAYLRPHERASVLVIHNLSSVPQITEIPGDYSDYQHIIYHTHPSDAQPHFPHIKLEGYASILLGQRPFFHTK